MKYSEDLQKLLPFGYLFLVIMGILKESVFYYQIGINILNYSAIMDILLSPIATLTTHPIVFLAVLCVVMFSYALPIFLSKKTHKKWVQKLAGIKNIDELSTEQLGNHFTNIFIKILGVGLLAFFLGIGVGGGAALASKINNNKLKYNYTLNYGSGEQEQIHLIGTNSIYYFYLAKGNKAVKIAPIAAVKNIEITDNRMLK